MNKDNYFFKSKNKIKKSTLGEPSQNYSGKNLLRNNLMIIPNKNRIDEISNKNHLNISKSEMNLLNQKIASQKNNISFLKSRLNNYENSKNEISRLKQELAKIKEALKSKNIIILEFQKLSDMTKQKFEIYINKTDSKLKEFNNKCNNFQELQIENKDLNQKLLVIKNENEKLKQKYQEMDDKNVAELNNAKNDIFLLKKNYEDLIKQNNFILNEKNEKNKEIDNLRNKLINQEKYEIDLEKIKKKYFLLETQINKKENYIRNLQKINETLEKNIKNTDDNYKRLMNEDRIFKQKIKNLESACDKYELNFQRINNNMMTNFNLNKNEINKRCKHNLNYSYSSRNKNIILSNNKNRIFYKHNNNNKIIGTEDNLRNNFRDYLCMTNNNNINYNNNYILNKSPSYENYKLNCLTHRNNGFYTEINKNKKNITFKKDGNYIKKSEQLLDKSFGYYKNYKCKKLI